MYKTTLQFIFLVNLKNFYFLKKKKNHFISKSHISIYKNIPKLSLMGVISNHYLTIYSTKNTANISVKILNISLSMLLCYIFKLNGGLRCENFKIKNFLFFYFKNLTVNYYLF